MIDILAVGAHPDDVELAASGTLISQISLGKSVAIVDLTKGELGTRGSAEIRAQESAAASAIMGITQRLNLGLADGFFEQDHASLIKLIEAIRYFKPNVLLANALEDRHPDHARAAHFISRACFLAGLRKIETTYEGVEQLAHRPKAVYHYIQDRFIKPDFVIDITPFFDQKMAAIKAYSSQFYNENLNEPQTDISSMDFIHYLEGRAREMGRLIGTTYGEGFNTQRPLGVLNLENFS